MPTVDRFQGAIAGFGTESGTRVVLGMWDVTPFGPIADAMVERDDGHRLLIAPTGEVADYIAATYTFDEIRVEPSALTVSGGRRVVTSRTLRAEVVAGPRTAIGQLLRTVPGPLGRNRLWVRAIDPFAGLLRDGVRTVGTAGNGRREYYCARDERSLHGVHAVLDGVALGALRPVDPPVRFGFGSTPATPSIVSLTTVIERP